MVVALGLTLSASQVRAETCPVPDGARLRLGSFPAAARLAFITARFDEERPRARSWAWTWTVVDAGIAVGQLVAVPGTSGNAQIFLGTGAALALAGVAQILLMPITPPELDWQRDAGCVGLADAERSFARAARNEELASGFPAHAGNFVINAGFGLALGLTGAGWAPAVLSGVAGWALGEAQILTQPVQLVSDLERYRSGDLGAERSIVGVAIAPVPLRGGAALALTVAF